MNRKLTISALITGMIISTIGLLNVVLGIIEIVSGAFPSAEGQIVAPEISVGSIVFGLIMLIAGALWTASGFGYFIFRGWASRLALYISPVVVAVNLLGVLSLWGFSVNIGLATLSTVAGIGCIWYLSKKELSSFLLISVAEHVIIIIIFAILIYSEPVDTAESTDSISVTIEEIKQQEPPLKKVVPPKKKVVREKKREEADKLPVLPRIELQIRDTEPGTKVEGSAPQLPRTFTKVMDESRDMVMRSPGPRGIGRGQTQLDDVSDVTRSEVESTLEKSAKSPLDMGPSGKVKKDAESRGAIERGNIQNRNIPFDERSGPSAEVAKPGFVGDITGEIAGRKVVFWPKPPEGYKGTEGGSATVKFWVDPSGSVTKAEISKKSGNPSLDNIAKNFVVQIRFAELPRNFQQKVQWGEISINFELIKRS